MVKKAYIARVSEEWCSLVHGETPGEAKSRFQDEFDVDFTTIGLKRIPGLDDKPITYENAKAAGFEYTDVDTEDLLGPDQFANYCPCEICRADRKIG